MRFAYADPPFPGTAAKFYRDHPDYAGEVDHEALIAQLVSDYPDGWALSTHVPGLRMLMPIIPEKARICAYVKTFVPTKPHVRITYSWEPLIVCGGRASTAGYRKGFFESRPRDSLVASPKMEGAGRELKAGAKGHAFCFWIFSLLGARPGDEMDDLFPGTGAVGRAWETWVGEPRRQGLLAIEEFSEWTIVDGKPVLRGSRT